MARRIIRGLVVLALIAVGLTAASPAMAASGTQCTTSNPNVHVCIYGKSGISNCTAWLSLKVAPSEAVHHYGLIMEINGKATQVASGVFHAVQNYPYPAAAKNCNSLPDGSYRVRSYAYIYTSTGILHYTIYSPYVEFIN